MNWSMTHKLYIWLGGLYEITTPGYPMSTPIPGTDPGFGQGGPASEAKSC